MRYSDWLREERTKRGFNQREFAELIGLTRNSISMIETNSINPSPKTTRNIKRVFDENPIVIPEGVEAPALT